ncbi:mevalonate kinase [Legionella waltersii]|uniref:Mevalonate kinase n=1 Tax=Legionella waltersii TaxID=66969 RepID=A0A0W0ZZX2_9GAMM|nr:hypothetical protein [Legionella waltersii]KTD74632.1 mevalonate kinase [Legionella waltersii]SNV08908.1 mevalonate kinase [Legionella waltersii]
MSFRTRVPAKCIIAGEHVIQRGGFALVSPLMSYHFSLEYVPAEIKTTATISGEGHNSLQVLLWPVVNHALDLLNRNPANLKGYFNIRNTIPIGGGLGFSAAISVAVAQWVANQQWIKPSEIFEFAVKLEGIFHGQSSGVDIAGVMSNKLIIYYSSHEIASITPLWKPKLYLSNSEVTSITKSCVEKVKNLRDSDKEKAQQIDDKMRLATTLVKEALMREDNLGLSLLINGLNLGNECYYEWGLVSPKLNDHVLVLKEHALATKIVGAGYGGHVLSLWKDNPPPDFPIKLYPLDE